MDYLTQSKSIHAHHDSKEPSLARLPPTVQNNQVKQPNVTKPDNSLDPITLPNGSILLPPFPQEPNTKENEVSFLPPELEWPQSILPSRTRLPRTKSFISVATTIAGIGSISLSGSGSTKTSDDERLGTADQKAPVVSLSHPENYPEIDYLQLVLQASTRVYDVAIETPLTFAKNLSAKVGRDTKIYLKRYTDIGSEMSLTVREDMQPICFSFKCRGAYNRISQLSAEERKRGIICMSAGNHAQGVALAAKRLNIKATIVMPTSASEIKYTNVRRLGSTVILCGADLEEAKKECLRLASEHGHIFVPPFDDPYIIAGQGTAGMEIIRQIRRGERLDAIFVPVGGGGLLAGIAAFMKRVQPSVKIIGVNTVDSSSMAVSLERGLRTALPTVGLFSDGTAVREIGAETYRICNDLVDDMVLVTVDEICAAIKDVFDDTRSILEPSGALGVAGIKKFLQDRGKHLCGGTFVAVTSGANMNFDRLRFVAERSRIGEGRECLLSCRVEEKPGSFAQLYHLIYPRSVTEVSYRYCHPEEAHVYIAFEVGGGKPEMERVVESINQRPTMAAINITENDMAKSHLRFLAGGRAPANSVYNEKLFRFSFPERPGSLKGFLEKLQMMAVSTQGSRWNLTLVHYRSTGGDVARILIGIDVPHEAEENGDLGKFLASCGCNFVEETNNPVYQHFLR